MNSGSKPTTNLAANGKIVDSFLARYLSVAARDPQMGRGSGGIKHPLELIILDADLFTVARRNGNRLPTRPWRSNRRRYPRMRLSARREIQAGGRAQRYRSEPHVQPRNRL